jgi:O-succinylbenzoate synthase
MVDGPGADGRADADGQVRGDAASPTPRRAWDALGIGTGLVLDAAEVWWVELPLVAPVGTAVGTHRHRPLALVRLRCHRDRDGAPVDGWGECAALADTTFDDEDVPGAVATLEQILLPGLAALAAAGGCLPTAGAVQGLAGAAPRHPLALAAVEMAVGDAHLRAADRSFADVLGVRAAWVTPGAVLGIPRSIDELLDAVEALAGAGYVRVKVKVSPDTGRATVAALDRWASARSGRVPFFQVDANGSYGPDDFDLLEGLDGCGLLCIEQPFARDDLDTHRRLAGAIATPVCLDESLDAPGSVIDAVTTGACSIVCVKPARLGGIGPALEVVDWCRAHDVPWWIGGMFESGYARRVTTALAALPGPALPGDLALPSTYLSVDLVEPVATRVDPVSGVLEIPVSTVPGMAPAPEPATLEALLVQRIAVPIDRN